MKQLDDSFVKSERIVVPVTKVLKLALADVAESHRVTVADIVRNAIFSYMENEYPEFENAYTQNLLRENKYGK